MKKGLSLLIVAFALLTQLTVSAGAEVFQESQDYHDNYTDESHEIIDIEEARRISDLLYAQLENYAFLMSYPSDLNLSAYGMQFLCSLEGFSATCYKDGTQSSIGYPLQLTPD